jgi:hypothetical protein
MPINDFGCTNPDCSGVVVDWIYGSTVTYDEPFCPLCGSNMEVRHDLSGPSDTPAYPLDPRDMSRYNASNIHRRYPKSRRLPGA